MTEKLFRQPRDPVPVGDPEDDHRVIGINTPSDLKFSITDCKMYVPVVTLQAEYQNQLYKKLKTGISIDFTWRV